MLPLAHAPSPSLAERSANILPPRLLEAPLSILEAPPSFFPTRLAQGMDVYSFWTWSTALPLLLWAGQEEGSSDAGGTLVFIACCVLTIGIFSKTGWRNEAPK